MSEYQNFQEAYRMQKKVSKKTTDKLVGMAKSAAVIIGGIIVLILLLNSFIFTVGEREQVVVTQFDEIIRIIVDDINEPSIVALKNNPRYANIKIEQGKGLFFKVPFIQSVKRFSNQLLTYDTNADEIYTLDKKTILVDNFAQWRISNPATFLVNIGNTSYAHQRLDEYIYSKIREEIGRIEAHRLVADKEYVQSMLKEVKDYVNMQMADMGIVVMDIRIKRTEYPDSAKPSIYDRMRSERQAVATQYRADGEKQARTIKSAAQKNATVIEARAYEEAQRIMGEGDAEALKIYADAYNVDPGFYEFWMMLQTYKEIIDKDTTIIIDSESPFAKYLFGD
jgi:membrane protease subunit HflC